MNYYIAYEQKKDFYLLGQLTPTSFHEGHAYKFLKEYISELQGLFWFISVIYFPETVILNHKSLVFGCANENVIFLSNGQ